MWHSVENVEMFIQTLAEKRAQLAQEDPERQTAGVIDMYDWLATYRHIWDKKNEPIW